MATQPTTSQRPKSTFSTLFGFALLSLCGNPLAEAAIQGSHLLCTLTGELLKLLPAIIQAACHTLGTYVLAHEWLFMSFQALVSCWPLLRFIFGAA